MPVSTVDVPTGNTFDKYGASNPVERRMMAGFLAAFDGMVERADPRRVLEVGAGEGELAVRLVRRRPSRPVVVLDLPDDSLADDWRGRCLVGVTGDAASLPVASGSSDLVMAMEVLEHVRDPTAVLRELARVSSAHVLVSVPREPIWRAGNLARGRYVRALGNTPGHVQHWSRRSFVELVDRHLDVVDVRSPLPWTMVLARVRG